MIQNVDIENILISNKVSFGKKSWLKKKKNDDYKIKLLWIMLPNMRGYANRFDETKYISFLIKDDRLLKKI